MSRTRRGSKGYDYEYWSARPFNKSGQLPGKFAKRRTHKAERAAVSDIVDEELVEMDDPNDEPCVICNVYHTVPQDYDECEQGVIDWIAEWEACDR